MIRNTLTLRLVVASTVWVVGSLLAAGILLSLLFRDHIERRFDATLVSFLEELVAASEITNTGDVTLAWTPADPRFNRPYSGWYWQILQGDVVAAQSESVWQSRLDIAVPDAGSGPRIQQFTDPGNQLSRALVQDITLPEVETHFTFVVAAPVADIESDVKEFTSNLAVTLAALGIGLLCAVLFQVGFGLRPLRAMRRGLTDIRSGKLDRLPESFPDEVQPVVTELNALLDHNAALLERARTQASNVAHGLKTSLTVITNEARAIEGKRGEILRNRAESMANGIDRYLSHARAVGPGTMVGARTPVKDVVDDLRFSMDLLFKDRALRVHASGLDGLSFNGDKHDLEEMLGNLMDNACKWARGEVLVRGERSADRVLISIEDDGPGISPEQQAKVLERGRRLDESVPGTGLGLDIVRDIAELYRGKIELGRSSLGGLSAQLDLPASG